MGQIQYLNLRIIHKAGPKNVLKPENIFKDQINEAEFMALCLETFHFQAKNNQVYKNWLGHLGTRIQQVRSIHEIPFLPIETFKSHDVVCGRRLPQLVFTSSSTSGQIPSRHFVNDPEYYHQSFLGSFRRFYGEPKDYCILALLPNYLSRSGSSLVYMCQWLIEQSGHALSGFFLDQIVDLKNRLMVLNGSGQKVLLIGVSYALIDLCEEGIHLGPNVTVMETGGMKGRRKEWTKEELHAYLARGFGIQAIHSEYGMTELLSQAYSKGGNAFETPPWMRFIIREVEDPLNVQTPGRSGGINVIDLANQHSCSFIATQDIGRLDTNGNLQFLGRYDHSDVRGCNLMVGNEI